VFEHSDPTAKWRRERCEFGSAPVYRAFIADLWGDFAASLNGAPNPFETNREFVNHLLHACPGVARIDKAVKIAGRVGKVLSGIRLAAEVTDGNRLA
jgi:hypothetical protein